MVRRLGLLDMWYQPDFQGGKGNEIEFNHMCDNSINQISAMKLQKNSGHQSSGELWLAILFDNCHTSVSGG